MFAYGAFVVGIVILMVKASGENADLVTPDYYSQELKYQQKIDESSRTAALSEAVNCTIHDNQLEILFPKEFTDKKITGTAVLYCPSDKNKDINLPFDIQQLLLKIELPKKYKGLYELHLSWEVAAVHYYYEKKIQL